MDASDAPSASALRAAHERFVTSPHHTPPTACGDWWPTRGSGAPPVAYDPTAAVCRS